MALDFPSSPTNGQTFVSGNRTWTYNTTTSSWEASSVTTSKTANYVYAAPNGSAGIPDFRALVAADIPTLNQNTTGTAATITGVYSGTITSGQITTGLGFTPYNATNPSGYTSNLGTVTGVTGTAPIVSSGGTAPAISISAATTSAAGSMSAADKTKLDGIATSANNYVLPKATATTLGGVEVFDASVQTVAANAVTTTASRTYGVQLNAADQMVVNVPWVDTNSGGTVTSVGGTGTVSGLTLSGTVTGSGNLTLGGTLSLTSTQVTTALTFSPAARASFTVSPENSVRSVDIRTLSNPTTGIGYVAGGRFRFSSLNDDNSGTYADVIDLSTYSDSSGGGFNSLYFGKNSQVMQHKYAAAGATTWTVKTLAYTDSNITGTAGSISGFNNPTTAPTASTIAYRDAAGDIAAREIVLSSGLSSQTPTVLVSMYPATNQMVRTTPAAVAAAIQGVASGSWGINITGSAATATDSTKLPLSGGTLTGVLTVPANATTSGGGINFAGTGSTFIRGTSGDGASSTTSNLQLQSWFGIGFGPSISGQTVPIGENAAWLDCRSGSFSARADFRAPIFYDSNNTSYYSDPSSTSRFSNFLLGGNEVYVYEGTTNVLNIRTGASPNHKYFGFGTDGRFTASNGGITTTSDARATIFYDVDNTAYYMNPLGTTNLLGNLYIARDGTSNDVFGGLEVREYSYAGAATGAATEAPGINFHWSNRGAARIYMNGAGNFVFAGQSDITNNRRDIIFASGYAATRVDAPIFYDSNNTAFYFDGASTTNINTMSGNSKTMFETADGYLRINQSSSFGQGIWTGSSNLLNSSGILGWGSNGGTTNSRVYINGGTYNGTNVISLDGSNGRITASDIRAPIFYDTDNTGFYVNPAGDTNLNKTFTYLGGKDVNTNWNTGFQNTPTQSYNFHGDVSSGGPAGTWWFYESRRHSNGSGYWGTQVAWGWEDNANRLQQRNIQNGTFSGWVEYLNTSDRTYNGNLYMTGSIRSTSSDMRAPIFYDQNDTGYYVNPNGTSYINALNIGPIANGASYLNINGYNAYGGTGYHGFLTVYNTYSSATNPQQYWRLNGAGGWEIVNSPYNAVLFTFTQGGDFTAAGNVTAYSDRKLKDNFEPISDAIQKVMQLNGVTFTRIDKEDTTTRYAGLIAQDVEPVLPEAVQKNDTMSYGEVLSVDYNGTIALLVEAIKEQQFQIIELKKELNKLLGE
jgi:hypothetical protein